MLNFKKSYLWINPGASQFFYDLVSGKGPPCVVKFWKELIGALIGDLDALKVVSHTSYISNLYYIIPIDWCVFLSWLV